MSMIGEYRRISLGQLQDLQDALRDNPEAVGAYLYPEKRGYVKPDPKMRIDKAWHGVHFLLNGKQYDGEVPLVNVVLGGTEIGDEGGYGRVRYLLPGQVKEASQALNALNKEELRKRFDPAAFEAAHIYPRGWTVGEPNAAFEWLWDNLVKARTFFTDAAYFGDVMLLYIS